jgi:hypothetical protein
MLMRYSANLRATCLPGVMNYLSGKVFLGGVVIARAESRTFLAAYPRMNKLFWGVPMRISGKPQSQTGLVANGRLLAPDVGK